MINLKATTSDEELALELDAFVERVKRSELATCFFHFTDTRNLPSIKEHGLLSMLELRERSIKVPAPGGNQWSLDADQALGMDRFVHLCFIVDYHPMLGRAMRDGSIEVPFTLEIRPEIIELPGVMVTDDVANGAETQPVGPEEGLGSLDLDVIYDRADWKNAEIRARRNAARRYEVLVPDCVPRRFIMNLKNG